MVKGFIKVQAEGDEWKSNLEFMSKQLAPNTELGQKVEHALGRVAVFVVTGL